MSVAALGLFSDSTLEMGYLSLFRLGNLRKKKNEKKKSPWGKKRKKHLFKNGSIELIDMIGTAKEQRPVSWNWE